MELRLPLCVSIMNDENKSKIRSLFPFVYGTTAIAVEDGWYDILVNAGIEFSLYGTRRGISVQCHSASRVSSRLMLNVSVPNDKKFNLRVRKIAKRAEIASLSVCERCGCKIKGRSCPQCGEEVFSSLSFMEMLKSAQKF